MTETFANVIDKAMKSHKLQIMQRDFKKYPYPDRMNEQQCKEYLANQIKKIAQVDTLDEDTLRHIDEVTAWVFDTNKWGIILMGSLGNGKTTMQIALINYLKWAYSQSCYEGMFKECPLYNRTAKGVVKDFIKNGDIEYGCRIYGIDDLGEEPKEVQQYGNICTPLVDLLEYTYSSKKATVITTNLDVAALKEKYGARVADRLKEMMTIISFTNGSYR